MDLIVGKINVFVRPFGRSRSEGLGAPERICLHSATVQALSRKRVEIGRGCHGPKTLIAAPKLTKEIDGTHASGVLPVTQAWSVLGVKHAGGVRTGL